MFIRFMLNILALVVGIAISMTLILLPLQLLFGIFDDVFDRILDGASKQSQPSDRDQPRESDTPYPPYPEQPRPPATPTPPGT